MQPKLYYLLFKLLIGLGLSIVSTSISEVATAVSVLDSNAYRHFNFREADNDSLNRRNRREEKPKPLLLTQALSGSSCFAISGAATPESNAINWTDENYRIFTVGNNTNSLGFQESGFEQEAFGRGRRLISLNDSNDFSFTGAAGAGSATSSVGTFSNGTLNFSTSYITTNLSEFRETTTNSFISSNTGDGVFIFPEQGGVANDFYTVSIDFAIPVTAFSLDLVDIFDTFTNNNPISSYEVYADGKLIAYFQGPFLGDDGVGAVNLYDGNNTLRGTPTAGQNIENTIGFVTDTPVSNVSIRHIINSGSILASARDPHGIDGFTYSTDLPCDHSDAPENSSTTGYGEATHIIVDGVKLGTNIDAETAAQNTANADGDDNDGTDDDDGVTIPAMTQEQTATITADVSGTGGYLQGWIDWNGNGSFDMGEQVASNIQDNDSEDTDNTPGKISFSVNVPFDAIISSNTFARFRWSTTQNLNTTTAASDGEVEDYQVEISSPISPLAGQIVINEVLYAQTGGNSATGNDEFIELFNASNNSVDLGGFQLIDGNLLADALDGNTGSITTSRNPYIFPSGTILQPGEYAVIWIGDRNNSGGSPTPEKNASGAAFQDWLGSAPKLLNSGDDIWLYDADTKVIDYMAYGTGSSINTQLNSSFNLWNNNSADEGKLDGAAKGQSISLTPNGQDSNSSVCWEKTTIATTNSDSASQRGCTGFLATTDTDLVDGRITSVGASNNMMNSDYGDAPSRFDNNDPAEHQISSNLYLGSVAPDSESNPQSSNDAGGDDAAVNGNIDDEDGISSFPLLKTDATSYSLTATVNNPNGVAANVYGWIDFDRDREFDQDERATVTSNSSGTVTLTWNIKSNSNPAGANILNGDTYVRIRVTTDNLDQTAQTTRRDDASIGLATNGEVEDYPLNIQLAPINAQSYCESIGGTLNSTNLFTEADNGTFGVGTAENQASNLPANLTTYTYNPNYPPRDGQYIVSTRRTQVGFITWHTLTGHTTGDVNDRFMVINANQGQEDTEMIQSTIVSNLTPNTNYTFTAYILNTVEINPNHIDPNVSFGIDLRGIDDDEDGTVDEDQEVEIRFSSGDIPESPQATWIRYSFLFNTGSATEARFVLRNNKIGGFGNDLAIDDISLHGCDLPVGNLEGKLYYDNNGNDMFDSGESGLNPGSTIRLIDTKGNSDPNDDVIVTRFANSGDDYSFLNIPQGSNYQITAPAQDTAGNPIGTTNPLTGITINTGQTTTNQNFGYDLNSKLLLVKRITAINPGKPDEIIFNGFENDPQDDSDDVANWSNKNVYLRGKISAENVKPGDEVEYTIYFLSDGINAVNNLSLCDVIPDNMTFVENSYGGTQGIGLGLANSPSDALPTEPNSLLTNANDSDRAEFYLPNSTPPTFCKKVDSTTDTVVPVTNTNNTNGAVVLDLGSTSLPAATAPGTPTDAYGFLRFRAKVK